MSSGAEIYHWLCRQPDDVAAVASLDPAEFVRLGGHLMLLNKITGIPGRIWGVCLAESFRRLMGVNQGESANS